MRDRTGAAGRVVATVASVLALGACVGSIDRGEFDDEVRSRGGGLDGSLVSDGVDAVARDLGVEDIEVWSVSIVPGAVTLQVRLPAQPDALDSYRYGTSGQYGGRGLSEPQPLSTNSAYAEMESRVFDPTAVGLDGLDEMVAEAIEAAGLDGGWASGASTTRGATPGADVVTAVTVTDERRTVVVTFGSDGTLLEVAAR